MKMFFVLAGALMATVSSCSKKAISDGEGPSELILSGQVQLKSSAEAAMTRGDGGEVKLDPLPAMNIGVYVLTSGDTPTDFNSTAWKNESFVSDVNGNISGGNVKLRTGTTYAIYAYAPRVADVVDATKVPVKHDEDVLYAVTPDVVGTAGGTKAKLAFKHAGSQIGFKLKCSDETLDMTNATLEVAGFYEKGTLDMGTGLMILENQTQKLTDKTGKKTNVLITGRSMGFSVTVSGVPGRSEPFTGVLSPTLVAGEAYLYTVHVNLDAGAPITFSATTVDWETVEFTDPVPVG